MRTSGGRVLGQFCCGSVMRGWKTGPKSEGVVAQISSEPPRKARAWTKFVARFGSVASRSAACTDVCPNLSPGMPIMVQPREIGLRRTPVPPALGSRGRRRRRCSDWLPLLAPPPRGVLSVELRPPHPKVDLWQRSLDNGACGHQRGSGEDDVDGAGDGLDELRAHFGVDGGWGQGRSGRVARPPRSADSRPLRDVPRRASAWEAHSCCSSGVDGPGHMLVEGTETWHNA